MTSVSVSAAWIEAIRNGPCLRIGTATRVSASAALDLRRLGPPQHLVAQQPLRFLDAALEVADRVDLGEVDADGDEGLGNLGGEAGDDHAGAHEPGRLDGLHEVVG